MANPHPSTAGNAAWRAAMAQAAFKKGWTNRKRCKAIKRDGTPCGRLAMTRYGLPVCGAHGGYAAAACNNAVRIGHRYSVMCTFASLAMDFQSVRSVASDLANSSVSSKVFSLPSFASCSRNCGEDAVSLSFWLNTLTMSGDVPAGAMTPNQLPER